MKILSIQSAVAFGHVGNSAAVFPLQRIGVEVLPVYTVNFSNHTGYGAWRGPMIAPDDVREVITGIEERGVFGQIDAVLSGYQGGEGIGDVIIDAVARANDGNGVIILTDMFGGTPSNLAISVMNNGNVEVIAGVNLPMLIKLAGVRSEDNMDKALQDASDAGRKYINVASRVLSGK